MSQTSPVSARDELQAHYNDLLALQDQTDQVPLAKALDAVGLALSLLGHAQTPAQPTMAFPRWWVQKCYEQLSGMGQLPSGPLGDWAFLFRAILHDALKKADVSDTSIGGNSQ